MISSEGWEWFWEKVGLVLGERMGMGVGQSMVGLANKTKVVLGKHHDELERS